MKNIKIDIRTLIKQSTELNLLSLMKQSLKSLDSG